MKLTKLQMQSFTEQTMAWTVEQVKLHRKVHGPDTDYWNQVGLVMTQLSAMTEGFNAAPSRSHHLPTAALFIMNMAGDMDDLLPALERRSAKMRGLVTAVKITFKLLISPSTLKANRRYHAWRVEDNGCHPQLALFCYRQGLILYYYKK